jgi:hypothetical protein
VKVTGFWLAADNPEDDDLGRQADEIRRKHNI